jgi:hypothetical protein
MLVGGYLRDWEAGVTKLLEKWFLVNDQRDAQFFTMYLFLFLTPYVFQVGTRWRSG